MPDVRGPTRAGALAGVLLGAGAVAAAAVTSISGSASVTEPASRGAALEVGEPDRPTTTPYGLPVADAARASWASTHASYPATDVFVGCGAELVSPVWGTVSEVRRVDSWDPAVDDPATRGGRSVAIVGFDGVRYYLAHFDTIVPHLQAGVEIELGESLGTMGDTGRTSACHLHFAISPPCANPEWSIRRGVIWPYPYLDAWRRGEQTSPVVAVDRWMDGNPGACAAAMADL